MEVKVSLENVYMPSDDVVAREIDDEFLIIPIATGIGDMEDELYSLNSSGKIIWDKLDGKKTLEDIKQELMKEYEVASKEIEQDIYGFIGELLKRNILVQS